MKTFSLYYLSFLCIYKLTPNNALPNQSRIIGGQQAFAGEYPFLAAISVLTPSSTFFCAGAIIGPRWILTAGQCVNGATLFNIALGSNILDGADDNRLLVATSDFDLHPDFNQNTLENDIGLIKLRMEITYTEYIQKIFMAFSALDEQTNLVAVGWGQTSDAVAGLSNNLLFAGVVALTNLECKAVYGNQISDNMVCVIGQYNEGLCTGDSGGPLLHSEGMSVVRHVGIASFYSGNGCENTNPSGYTRTLEYKSWITNVTGIIS